MRATSTVLFVLSLQAIGCSAAPPESLPPTSQRTWRSLFSTTATNAPQAPATGEVAVEEGVGPAEWIRTTSDYGVETWTRSRGDEPAPTLAFYGTAFSGTYNYGFGCESYGDTRLGAPERNFTFAGRKRPLHVWLRASGTVALFVHGVCSIVEANKPVSVEVPAEDIDPNYGFMIQVLDVDRLGERRGRTTPFVLVVTERADEERTERPEPLPKIAGAIPVRWDLKPAPCPADTPSNWRCYKAAALFGGERLTVPGTIRAQDDCWPEGTSLTCGGASGGTIYALEVDDAGHGKLTSDFASDGACEDGEVCNTVELLRTFEVVRGSRLIADPAGTLPPWVEDPFNRATE
ncbi:MAG: hypothetical protein U0271_28950 [Polyangiaceae bacterium]